MPDTCAIPRIRMMARINALSVSLSYEGEYLVFANTHRICRELST